MKNALEIEIVKHSQVNSPSKANSESAYFHRKTLVKEDVEKLKQLEGECKILEYYYLHVNYPKAVLATIFMTVTIFGLLFLKYYKSLRAMLFYDRLSMGDVEKATHIYVLGTDKNEEICNIFEGRLEEAVRRIFEFKNLKYEINEETPVPLGLQYARNIEFYISDTFFREGLTNKDAHARGLFYGCNEHRVEVPGYLSFLFDTMTRPFFIFQYIVSIIYILENVAIFGILMIAFSWITTTVNYVLLRNSYNQIKETAEKEFAVRVLRNGNFNEVKNVDLVPGDLYQPGDQVPCDSIMIQGELFVNEASLTGENVPIAKFKLTHVDNIDEPYHWIFQGSKIQTIKEGTLALAVNVGFGSRRGRIIRKILTKIPKSPQFFFKLVNFLVEVLLVAIVVYCASLRLLLGTGNYETVMVAFRFLDFITYAFPAPFPIFFNLAYSFCLVRLNKTGILGTECEKTVESGRMKTLCFDKTGTLTQTKVQISKVFHIKDKSSLADVTQEHNNPPLLWGLFGCCHSVQMINGSAKGDEIDLQMFVRSEGRIQASAEAKIIRCIVQKDQSWQVLKINQYESKFQSMSVVARHRQSKKCYIFVKGSPEMIHTHSQLKYNNYDEFIKRLSLEGYRSIGFGYREMTENELGNAMNLERGEFLKGTRILGVVSFINLLKDDARETIDILTRNEINTKIITGDNIFLGIQTAIMTGMISPHATVAVLQGRKYHPETGAMEVLTLSRNAANEFIEKTEQMSSFRFDNEVGLVYAVDNDFVKARGEDFLHHRIKVFARISPQNKALIVRKHKEIYKKERQSWSCLERMFGECGYKVGMVGDGANDLIAIKEADVGIGISSTDAVYSASFAVKDLIQIDQIIREAKNTERQIIDLVQYFSITQIISLSDTLILTKDSSFPNSQELIYKNFANSLLITLFFAFSKPAQRLTKYLTATNFMGLEHHLVYWGNAFIYTAGLVASYQYYYNSSDFTPNSSPSVTFSNGYNGDTKSATIIFLCENIIYIFMGVFIYRSSPWKEPFWTNKPFTVVVVVNIILIIPMFFLTQYLSFMSMEPIAIPQAAVCLGIMSLTTVIAGIYNYWIEKKAFHERENNGDSEIRTEIIQEQKISQ